MKSLFRDPWTCAIILLAISLAVLGTFFPEVLHPASAAGASLAMAAPGVIDPSVGRKLWYFPNGADNDVSFRPGEPLDVSICGVHSGVMINVWGADFLGRMFVREKMRLVQDGEQVNPGQAYCAWMPFQIGQARKSDPANALPPQNPSEADATGSAVAAPTLVAETAPGAPVALDVAPLSAPEGPADIPSLAQAEVTAKAAADVPSTDPVPVVPAV